MVPLFFAPSGSRDLCDRAQGFAGAGAADTGQLPVGVLGAGGERP